MNYIHETVIRDIVDLVSAAKDYDPVGGYDNFRKNNMKSIHQAASKSILVFPVVIDKSNSIKNGNMVNKAIERKATTFVRLVLAANQVQNIANANEVIQKFHINLDTNDKISVDDVLNVMDKYVAEHAELHCTDTINITEARNLLASDMRNINHVMENSISDKSINDFNIITKEQLYQKPSTTFIESATIGGSDPKDNFQDETKKRVKNALDNLDKLVNKTANKVNKGNMSSKETLDALKSGQDYLRNQLLDNDVKKANELIETTLTVSLLMHDEKSGTVTPVTFLLGIKAKLYPVDTTDMITRLVAKDKDSNWFVKFIRASTREISFVKDFLFSIDKAKIDALSQSKRGSSSSLWNVLERRATKSKVKRGLGLQNDAMSITTFCVSQELVETVKKEYNINLEDSSTIKNIIEGYNLLCFCIIDDTNDVAKFAFDDAKPMFETIAFSGLEREAKDNDYKTAVTLMSKMLK